MRGKRAIELCVILTATLSAIASAPCGAADEPVMKVRIGWPTATQLTGFQAIHDIEIMGLTPGEEVMLASNARQVEKLEALGFAVDILVPDLQEYYIGQRTDYRNFGLLYTYSEMVTQFDQLHAQYPNITTAKFSIGTSWEGRTVWAIKVSDNPNVDEDEPEVLFDGTHHAREPITVNVLVETVRYLCEHYATDPEIAFLVDNREVFFVPVINPDGYLYNEQQAPGGGGMWRKNRRAPTSGCYGVDLNRNYSYQWGGVGSSSDPCDDTYRGPAPVSEPEVQALVNFINDHEFVTHDSYHSVAGLLLFPWGYTNNHTEDDALFRVMGAAMSEYNGYTPGQPGEVLYNCSGTTFDWAYGDRSQKPKVFSFSTEVSGSGFWPLDSEVAGLVAENIPVNLYLMRVAGCYPTVASVQFNGGDGDGLPEPGETLDMVVNLHNDGVIAPAQNVVMTLASDDAYVQLNEAASTVGTIPAGGDGSNASDPFRITIDPSCPAGHTFAATIHVSATGFDMDFARGWAIGEMPVLFSDTMEQGVGGWTHSVVTGGFVDQWHQSTRRNHTVGGTYSWKFGDTGSGAYANLADGALVTPGVESYGTTVLTFWHWIDAETSGAYPGRCYDGGIVEMSIDGGPWTQITPEAGYTHTIRRGGTPGPFAEGTPCFSGQINWREDVFACTGAAGSIRFRFRFGSDGADTREGWYVDDVRINGRPVDNLAPGAPILVSPFDGETVATSRPLLTVRNAVDPDPGDVLTYGFQVFADVYLTQRVAMADGVPEGSGTTAWRVSPSLPDGAYYWRAYAFDGDERGPCMHAARFIILAGQTVADEIAPAVARLVSIAPNPSSGRTTLRFQVATSGALRGGVYDLQGRLLRRLSARCVTGTQDVVWDGRDDSGRPVPAGMYLYRFDGSTDRSARILIMR